VPFDRLGEALDMIERIGREHGAEVACWGHAGDGNVHASVLADRADAAALRRAEAVGDAFHAVPRALSGSLTAEHGVGAVKLEAAAGLPAALLRAQRGVAGALDRAGLANPRRKIPRA
jgi:glycolate oxidase